MESPLPESADRFRRDLLEWAEDNLREYPWRELERSFYEVFIAEFFLTQTPPSNVRRIYPDFIAKFPDLDAVDEARLTDLEAAIEPLGFQRMRAEALNEIASSHDALPRDVEQLESLPRVGPYVANATMCFCLVRPVPIIDRNVVRVYSRVFGDAFPKLERERRRFAERMLPNDGVTARTYNLALIDFGSTVCTKLESGCDRCFAEEFCVYRESMS